MRDSYETTLVLTDVRLAYVFCIRQQGTTYYFCEDGVVLQYDFAEGFYNFFQMPYINRNDVLPTVKWMKSAVFYQIFVDRFFCGNTKKDCSYINMEWGALPTPKSFAGGDLCGIIEKLDYLKELGITAIYLTPIFRSISNHKYDTMDYMQIDPQSVSYTHLDVYKRQQWLYAFHADRCGDLLRKGHFRGAV